MSDLLEIIVFLSSVMSGLFSSLDSVMWGSVSVLRIFVACVLFESTIWFIFKMLGHEPAPIPVDEKNEEWGLTDQEREDRAAFADVDLHAQKERWATIGNDPMGDRVKNYNTEYGHIWGQRDSGFEYDGAGNLRSISSTEGGK